MSRYINEAVEWFCQDDRFDFEPSRAYSLELIQSVLGLDEYDEDEASEAWGVIMNPEVEVLADYWRLVGDSLPPNCQYGFDWPEKPCIYEYTDKAEWDLVWNKYLGELEDRREFGERLAEEILSREVGSIIDVIADRNKVDKNDLCFAFVAWAANWPTTGNGEDLSYAGDFYMFENAETRDAYLAEEHTYVHLDLHQITGKNMYTELDDWMEVTRLADLTE